MLQATSYKIQASKIIILFFIVTGLIIPKISFAAESAKIRAGHFSTVTHAPALIGRAQGKFEEALKNKATIDWKIFNAGPLAIEGVFAGEIDILYVGPNPAINGFVKSRGQALRILSGVASGGSAFVVRPESDIEKFEDIKGKRVVTPQLGNTQDVALRYLMKEKNLKSKTAGGNVEIFNLNGGEQITVLSKGDVDAVWTVEPLVSRLEAEAGGKILFDEKELWPNGQYATAVLVVRKKFLDEHPELVQEWVNTHVEIIRWMKKNPEEAKKIFNAELKRETGAALLPQYLDSSFKRIEFTYSPLEDELKEAARQAFAVGFLGRVEPNLNGIYDLKFVNQAQAQDQ